jgi:hypothetical protein
VHGVKIPAFADFHDSSLGWTVYGLPLPTHHPITHPQPGRAARAGAGGGALAATETRTHDRDNLGLTVWSTTSTRTHLFLVGPSLGPSCISRWIRYSERIRPCIRLCIRPRLLYLSISIKKININRGSGYGGYSKKGIAPRERNRGYLSRSSMHGGGTTPS